jgi:predicted nucleic acid-binding protein
MTKQPSRIYWDSVAWIAYIQKEMPGPNSTFSEPRYDMCRRTLKRAEAGELEIATSAFTLAEVCKQPLDPTSPGLNLAAFFDQKYILLVPVDKPIGLQAQKLQSAGVAGLKPPDAIHLASAIVHDIPVLHTFDGKLLNLNKMLQTANGSQLHIVRPTEEIPLTPMLQAMQDGG